MSDLRKRFEEKLSERVKIILIDCDFNDFENRYCYCDFERKDDFNLGVINGAWYMFFEDHEKQQTIIDDLKTQLSNMEACYIEKKKELEDQHKKVDEVLEYLDGESANRWGLWKEKADMLDQGASNAFEEAYWMVKKALRGEE